MSESDLSVFAHLMRRAGFGAMRSELDGLAAKGYEGVVEYLINPERLPEFEVDLESRYFGNEGRRGAGGWIYRMVNSERQLEEKMALFWHHVFATSEAKGAHNYASNDQIDLFRRIGLSDLRTILIELSKDPAMIFWLDNNENRRDEPNENYGRELLELFSMGVGNYTEEDVKMCARAFTGWTFAQAIPFYPHGRYPVDFVFRDDDHDYGEKAFLGETGRFNGEDIIDIIVKQPATARFISRHLYSFFVADEPHVAAWNDTPPQDPEAIETLAKAYFDSAGETRSMLRALFNSDFFKNARLKKVKSPTELVAGIIRLVGTFRLPEPGLGGYYAGAATAMGQRLLYPPTVEGWHTGQEWIDGGTLNQRVNFAVKEIGDYAKPGVRAIVEGVGPVKSSSELVDRCLDLIGPISVSAETRDALVRHADRLSQEEQDSRVVLMLQQIVATREFQLA